ncbi:hypothetical protein MBLNU230_g5974t1 [Neophaeotheca triangularis]
MAVKRKLQEANGNSSKVKKVATQSAAFKPKPGNATKENLKQKPKASSSKPAASRAAEVPSAQDPNCSISIQIVTGSYERVLHGLAATIPQSLLSKQSKTPKEQPDDAPKASFSDTFLFAAHTAAVRCLAVSPPTEADKRILATGGADERINLYSISTAPPQASQNNGPALPSLSRTAIVENSKNRSLGSLVHHDRAVTRLHFPAKGKLFSSAEDSTVAISRTRDWTVLSTIKAPIPKVQGRPSGDTAGPGEVPAGVNDFAIHPSQKLMLSVGKGERCMRLWNLMTGKKAGVLNFDRDLLAQVGEGRFSSGEGRRVLWDAAGENYVVGFERGAVLFGLDSEPKAVFKAPQPTKWHQMRFVEGLGEGEGGVFSVSTEDGRILFFSTEATAASSDGKLPQCACVAQLGGTAAGTSGRVKDFETLQLPAQEGNAKSLLVVTGSSDGAVRLWTLQADELLKTDSQKGAALKQVGSLVGTQETGDRITCLGAFVMDGNANNTEDDATIEVGAAEEEGEEDGGSSEDE